MGKRDDIRKATLGAASATKRETVEVNGQTVEIRQLSLARRDVVYERARDAKGKFQAAGLAAAAIIEMVYDPETDERVYETADFDALVGQEAGGWADTLGQKCIQMMNGTKEAQEEAEKN